MRTTFEYGYIPIKYLSKTHLPKENREFFRTNTQLYKKNAQSDLIKIINKFIKIIKKTVGLFGFNQKTINTQQCTTIV